MPKHRASAPRRNAQHYGYTDLEQFLGQLESPDRLAPKSRARVAEVIGTIQPPRAVAAERAYIAAFFTSRARFLASG